MNIDEIDFGMTNFDETDFDLNLSSEQNFYLFGNLIFNPDQNLNLNPDQNLKLNPNNIGPELDVKIDFDFASKAWRKNKIHIGNGVFSYRCGVLMSSGKICKKSKKTCKSAQHIKKRND